MAYQLEYCFDRFRRTHFKEKKNSMLLAAILLSGLAVSIYFYGATAEAFFLGNREELKVSAAHMVDQLRSGTDFNDAVYTFCENIANAENLD